jgi:hypothetical protein
MHFATSPCPLAGATQVVGQAIMDGGVLKLDQCAADEAERVGKMLYGFKHLAWVCMLHAQT